MFNIGAGEMMLIALVLLIAVGPEQLPGLIRRTGRVVGQLKTMSDNLRRDFNESLDEIERAADVKGWAGGELEATAESVKEAAAEPFKFDSGIDGSAKVKDIWSRPPEADPDSDPQSGSEPYESPTTDETDGSKADGASEAEGVTGSPAGDGDADDGIEADSRTDVDTIDAADLPDATDEVA